MKDGTTREERAAKDRAGLIALVREAAEQPKDDVILQALHVACGAVAIGCESPCTEEQIERAIQQASAEVDACLAHRWGMP